MAHLQASAVIGAPRSTVFGYLCDPKAVPQLLQDSIEVEWLAGDVAGLRRGSEITYEMTRFGLVQKVRLKIEDIIPGLRLTYRQSEGLFKMWVHTQKFEDHGQEQTLVTDLIEYELPFGLLGHMADDLWVRSDLERILDLRFRQAQKHFGASSDES